MDNNYDNLRGFIERMKSITFWERLFRWNTFQQQLMNAIAEFQKLTGNLGHLMDSNGELKTSASCLSKELEISKLSPHLILII